MRNPMSSVSGAGPSILLHSLLLLGLISAAALRVSPLPFQSSHRPPVAPYHEVALAGAGGGGPSSPVPPPRGAPVREPSPRRETAPMREPSPAMQPGAGEPVVLVETLDSGASQDGTHGGELEGIDGSFGGGGGNAGRAGGGGGIGEGGFGDGATDHGGSGETLYLDETIVPPVLVLKVIPIYPEMARAARLEATLRFQIVVDESGNVREITPLKTHPLFEPVAVGALSAWKYRPGTLGGIPVRVYLLVVIEFKLR